MTKLDDVVEEAWRVVTMSAMMAKERGACLFCDKAAGMAHEEWCGHERLKRALDALHASERPGEDAWHYPEPVNRLNETDAVLALMEDEPEVGGSVRG